MHITWTHVEHKPFTVGRCREMTARTYSRPVVEKYVLVHVHMYLYSTEELNLHIRLVTDYLELVTYVTPTGNTLTKTFYAYAEADQNPQCKPYACIIPLRI